MSMTLYHIYSDYKSALKSGKTGIKFVSLKRTHLAGNPVCTDMGMSAAAIQSGDY